MRFMWHEWMTADYQRKPSIEKWSLVSFHIKKKMGWRYRLQLIELNSAEWHCLVHEEIVNFKITWIRQQKHQKNEKYSRQNLLKDIWVNVFSQILLSKGSHVSHLKHNRRKGQVRLPKAPWVHLMSNYWQFEKPFSFPHSKYIPLKNNTEPACYICLCCQNKYR